MKRRLLLLLFLSIYATQMCMMMAQQISGRVADEKSHPLPYVSVILRQAEDYAFVGGVAADKNGAFSIPAKEGIEYRLYISYVGYLPRELNCLTGNVGTITLQENTTMLDEVSVVASRTQHNATGYTVNLQSSDIVKGKQTADMLTFLPGVSVENGAYKINGLPVSQIYVDGVKLSSLAELSNLPADMIEKVKVNYLASLRQNASELGGTIEISLRQPPKGGYYGALTADATLFPSYGFSNESIGGIIYYRYKDLSLYDNLSVDFNQPQETSRQTIWNPSTDLRTEIDEETKHIGHTISNRLSLSQQWTNRMSLGGSYYLASNYLRASSSSALQNAAALQSAIIGRTRLMDQEGTLKFSTPLNQRGASLDATADYFHRHTNNNTNYTAASSIEDISHISKVKSSLDMYKLAVDITYPQSQTLIWKYGASAQYITSDYRPQVNSMEGADRFPTSVAATNTSGFTPLAYISAMGMWWKIRYSAGLNWQLNRISYHLRDSQEKSLNTQWGINPSVQMMMPLDAQGKYALMLNYKRALDDIPYAAISSTVRWTDAYNYTVGNPKLKSPTTDMVMAGISMFGNLLNLTAIYAHAQDQIYWETFQSKAAPNIFYTSPINLSSANVYGVGAEMNWRAIQQWSMKLSGRLEIHPENITLGGIHYGNTNLRQYYAMYNSLYFGHGWGGMLSLMCEPTYTTYDRTYHTVYNVGGQIYKSLLHDALRLSLTFDAFGQRRKYDRRANGTTVSYDYTTPVQNVGISLVWNFSGGKSVNVNAVEQGTQNFKEIKDVR